MKHLLSLILSICFLFAFESPVAMSATLIDSKQRGDLIYFLLSSPSSIERYDTQNESFLETIYLPHTLKAFDVDSDGIYVSYGNVLNRLTLNGTDETHLRDSSADTEMISVIDDHLIFYVDGPPNENYLYRVNKVTGDLLDSRYCSCSLRNWSIALSARTIFARSQGISPSDIYSFSFNADGILNKLINSPYHGDYPDASITYVFPDDRLVADSSGIVYSTADLTYRHSFAGAFDDITFNGDAPVILRSGTLYSCSGTFLETGKFTPLESLERIFSHQEFILVILFQPIRPIRSGQNPTKQFNA